MHLAPKSLSSLSSCLSKAPQGDDIVILVGGLIKSDICWRGKGVVFARGRGGNVACNEEQFEMKKMKWPSSVKSFLFQ